MLGEAVTSLSRELASLLYYKFVIFSSLSQQIEVEELQASIVKLQCLCRLHFSTEAAHERQTNRIGLAEKIAQFNAIKKIL